MRQQTSHFSQLCPWCFIGFMIVVLAPKLSTTAWEEIAEIDDDGTQTSAEEISTLVFSVS